MSKTIKEFIALLYRAIMGIYELNHDIADVFLFTPTRLH